MGDYADVFALNCTSFDDARSAIEEAREIVALCEIAKLPSMTASLIAGRTSLADARAKVIAARAAAAPRIQGGAGPESFHVPAGPAPVREPEPQPDALAKKLNFNNLYAARQAAKTPA